MFVLYKAATDDLRDLNLPVDKSSRSDILKNDPDSFRLVLRIVVIGLGLISLVAATVATITWSRIQEDGIPNRPKSSNSKNFIGSVSISSLEQHNTANNCWVALYGNVYDLSAYNHPGTQEMISRQCGMDITTEYASIHPEVFIRTIEHWYIGVYEENAVDASSEEPVEDRPLGKCASIS
jgi:cytochrome b involved in lipid metabolism